MRLDNARREANFGHYRYTIGREMISGCSEAETMKMKTWTVIANTGKQADLEFGLEKKKVQRPTHISAKDFIHWIAPDTQIDDAALQSLFKL
jgi:hypothetical protein